MGAPFKDITLYNPVPYEVGTPEYGEYTSLTNYVSDLYIRKMDGYKPPHTTRISINPAFHTVWTKPSYVGSVVAIAPFYSHDEFLTFDTKGRYKYILDLIQTATLQLSGEYGWDKKVFERAYREVLECDFRFKVEYPAKLSRDKKKTGQVIIEKTQQLTTLSLLITLEGEVRKVPLFQNRNWFWYDVAYEIAKHAKWLDNNCFGVFSKKTDKYGYYSISDDRITGKLDYAENEFLL